ncbi:MAG TPA: DUF2236 domain-containing protein [Leptolyngbyaceae cyanobacterium M65_K2018_010]|nr:DUF2236 domain-containing protein [Leptolyngbyaceae cyanobacterium M65_K2018_010]
MDRYATLRYLQSLDPEQDHQQICYWLAGYEFPWDLTRALEIALLRTFCVPSIAQLLDQTGEFHHHPQKRYDDTGIVVSEVLKHGYESPRGAAFIQRMNAIHSHYPIANEDYLYVLSTFVFEPIRWCDRFGWRPFCQVERLACFYFWRTIGDRMGITALPNQYDEFEQFNRQFEAQRFSYTGSNQRVANATRSLLLSWFPAVVRPIVNQGLPSLLDPPMLQALGWEPAPAWLQGLMQTALIVRSRWLRQRPPRSEPDFFVDQTLRSYPQGYSLQEIGPESLQKRLNRP